MLSILKEISAIACVDMPIGETWTISRCRYQSEDGAPGRLCIATGIHGDELMGQLIAYDVARRIQAHPEHLHGTVDLYPMLNPLGLDIGERMVPSATHLDMNRAFPGNPDGTALESLCAQLMTDMLGADLVLDLHAGTQQKRELYQVRIAAAEPDALIDRARALWPELIWVYPDKAAYSASLTGALCREGTPALILEADENRRRPQPAADAVTDGILCTMREMGIWSGESIAPPTAAQEIPVIRSQQDVCRVGCSRPGLYVPRERIGTHVQAGDTLGVIVDALHGEAVEEVKAPEGGLVFSQRCYSAVYPGTMIARLCRREQA